MVFIGALTGDPAGNIYVTGGYWGELNLGGASFSHTGSADPFLASFDRTGAHRWSTVFIGDGHDEGKELLVSPEGTLHVVGDFAVELDVDDNSLTNVGEVDVWMASLAADTGAVLRAHGYGGAGNDYAHGLSMAEDSSIVVAGQASPASAFGTGELPFTAGFIARYAPDGAPIWSRHFSEDNNDVPHDVVVHGGRTYLVGTVHNVGQFDMLEPVVTEADSSDAGVIKLSTSDGSVASVELRGRGPDFSTASVAAVDYTGALIVAGSFRTDVEMDGTPEPTDFGGDDMTATGEDLFVAAYDDGRVYRYSVHLDSLGACAVHDLTVDDRGYAYLAGFYTDGLTIGTTTLAGAGLEDGFLVVLDPDGGVVFARRVAGPGRDEVFTVYVTRTREVYVAGHFSASAEAGSRTFVSDGDTDAFILQLLQ
jgi:hypothetical protein